MNEEFVTYEQALALKKLGFDESCFGFYENGVFIFWYDSKQETELLLNCSAPLKQQVFRWFREEHGLSGIPDDESYSIWKLILGVRECIKEVYPLNNFEEAESACIDELIKIIKKKI